MGPPPSRPTTHHLQGWKLGFKREAGTSHRSCRSKISGVRGVWKEGFSVGLGEILVKHSLCMQLKGEELLTQTADIVRWWKEHFEELNLVNTSAEEA